MLAKRSSLIQLLILGGTAMWSGSAEAAAVWVERPITLPRHDWAFDAGLGLGYRHEFEPSLGAGFNLEGAVGVTRRLELGVRTGILVDDEARYTRADEYGRLFDRQTFGMSAGSIANPEVRIRGTLVSGAVAELAIEGRTVLPIEAGSRLGLTAGLPLHLHLGYSARLDTGIYVPVVFYDPRFYAISVPLDVWIQVSAALWLGPMLGYRTSRVGDVRVDDWSLGFGLGYELSRAVDLKTMVLLPGVNHGNGTESAGVGVGIQVRIE